MLTLHLLLDEDCPFHKYVFALMLSCFVIPCLSYSTFGMLPDCVNQAVAHESLPGIKYPIYIMVVKTPKQGPTVLVVYG